MNNKNIELQMRELFNAAQHLHKHNKTLNQMKNLFENYSFDVFYDEFIRNMKMTVQLETKSPYTKHVIEFLCKFLMLITEVNSDDKSNDENEVPENPENESRDEIGMESLGNDSFRNTCDSRAECLKPNITDIILKKFVIPYLLNINTTIRYNTIAFVRRLFASITDVDDDIYSNLKEALIIRCVDKEKSIRSITMLSLHRFQESDDPKDRVMNALKFHLRNDPDFGVRQSCVLSLKPCKNTLDEFIHATRDIKDIIRKTAFTIIADKIHIKRFSIDQRLTILKNGLNERSAAVKQTVVKKLIPAWIKNCDNDLVKFLDSLDIQSDLELIDRLIFEYFEFLLNEDDENGKRRYDIMIETFVNTYLNEKKMLTKVALNVELAFLWRNITQFCKTKDITIMKKRIINNGGDSFEGECIETEEKEDLIDYVTPDLPYFCTYLIKFIENVRNGQFNDYEITQYEFVYNELLKLCLFYDVPDNTQRDMLSKCLHKIIQCEDLNQKFSDYISPLMKCFATKVFSDSSDLLTYTVELIREINTSLVEEETSPKGNILTTEEHHNLEMEYARLIVDINDRTDKFDDAKKRNDFVEAQRLKEEIDEMSKRKQQIMDIRLASNETEPETQETQQSQNQMNSPNLTDHPEALERCLLIFCGCLEFGKFNELNAIMYTHVEKVCILSLPNEDPHIRKISLKCIALACMISATFCKRYFALFVEVLNYDVELVQIMGLKSMFDILCVHGFNIFDDNKTNDKENTLRVSEKSRQSLAKGDDYAVIDDLEEMDPEKTIIDNGDYGHDEDTDELNIDKEFLDVEEEKENFTTLLTNLLVQQLNSDSEIITEIASEGIGKLLLLGRIYSPQILSKLIILWFDPDVSTHMRQFIGVFLPIYANIEPRVGYYGQHAFVECFINTIEDAYSDGREKYNLDNMMNFMMDIINDEGHRKLALPIANKILTLTVENDLAMRYFLRALSSLRLYVMESQDLKDLRVILRKIERNSKKFKGTTKNTIKKIENIQSKIGKQMEYLQLELSQMTIEDFGSQKSSNSDDPFVSNEN